MSSEPSLKDVNVNEISLILKILKGEKNLTTMSKDLGITLQGVRYYITSMRDKGLLEDFRVTPSGYEYISSAMKLLKKFVIEGADILFSSADWEAIGDDNLNPEDEVFLYMKGGYLHASLSGGDKRASAKSCEKATKGHKIRIRDVKGIINIEFGTVTIEMIDNLNENNFNETRKSLELRIKETQEDRPTFILGEGIYSLLKTGCVNLYAPLAGAFDAANRGVNSTIYTTREAFNLNFDEFSNLKERFSLVKTIVTTFKI
ncbi:MAG: hypothetical protein ACYCSO_05830 [Cuniculiplasma sp.]